MRAWIILFCGLLGACASGAASYELDRGVAGYDTLKAATDKCHAEGGVIVLKNGYDNQELSNYSCKIGGTR
jgi:hypothetical protein